MPIVTATASFSSARGDMARRIESAMSGAALQASAEDITDPKEVRRLMLAARERAKAARPER